MVEELDPGLDPGLETMLRSALRREADALPMTLRASDVERAWSERARVRRKQRWTVAAIAAVVVALGGVALATALRPSGPEVASSTGLADLPSFERLEESIDGAGPAILRLQEPTDAQAGRWQFGLPTGAYAFEYIAACAGSNEMAVSLAPQSGPMVTLGRVACDGGVWRLAWDGTDQRAILAAASVSIRLDAQPGTAWRMLVAEDGSGRIVQHLGAASIPFRLPSMDFLVQQRSAGAIELVRGSGLNQAASGSAVSMLRGLGASTAVEVDLACSGSDVTVSFASQGSTDSTGVPADLTCDGTMQTIYWARASATADVSEIGVSVPPGTAWEAIVYDTSASLP